MPRRDQLQPGGLSPSQVACSTGSGPTHECGARTDAWQSRTHSDLPIFLDHLRGVAHTSREVMDSGFLQSYAQLRQEVVVALRHMDDEVL